MDKLSKLIKKQKALEDKIDRLKRSNMALIDCDCKNKVSSKAKTCPHCGKSLKTDWLKVGKIAVRAASLVITIFTGSKIL